MKTKKEEFEVLVPNLDGTAVAERVTVTISLKWDEELKEWLLTPEAHELIENTKARRMGLLLPAQFKELRERYQYSQKEMGELFQVGEKSWTRWESGKHRPSRSINLIIRALYEGEISINYLLRRAGKPEREDEKREQVVSFSIHEMARCFSDMDKMKLGYTLTDYTVVIQALQIPAIIHDDLKIWIGALRAKPDRMREGAWFPSKQNRSGSVPQLDESRRSIGSLDSKT